MTNAAWNFPTSHDDIPQPTFQAGEAIAARPCHNRRQLRCISHNCKSSKKLVEYSKSVQKAGLASSVDDEWDVKAKFRENQ